MIVFDLNPKFIKILFEEWLFILTTAFSGLKFDSTIREIILFPSPLPLNL